MLKQLYLRGIVTKQQIRRGLDRIYIDAENIKEDVPNFSLYISKLILKLVQSEVLISQVLIKIPVEFREEMEENKEFSEYFTKELEIFKNEIEIKEKFSEVLSMYEKADVINHLENLGHPEIVKPWFIRKAILISCGKGNNEREEVSQLLKELGERKDIDFAMVSY